MLLVGTRSLEGRYCHGPNPKYRLTGYRAYSTSGNQPPPSHGCIYIGPPALAYLLGIAYRDTRQLVSLLITLITKAVVSVDLYPRLSVLPSFLFWASAARASAIVFPEFLFCASAARR